VLPTDAGLLDAPVLGSTTEAETGRLRVFLGGPDALVKRWTPALGALGSPLHVGPLGAGASAKLVANAALLGTLTLVGETLALAEALGLSRELAFEDAARVRDRIIAMRRRLAGDDAGGEDDADVALAMAAAPARRPAPVRNWRRSRRGP
jgi:3-hydroxyisobutyrate dehydrogenase/2-hydroxy-3-oxopropionate reductase